MAVVQFISDDDKVYFGTTQRDLVPVVVLTPIQLVGMAPGNLNSDDCRGDVCITMPVFNGDFSSFLYQFATDAANTDDYRLEEWDGTTWNEVVTGNLNNTLGTESGTKFTFGSFPEYPTYSGFILDWEKIVNLFGASTYRFRVKNIFEVSGDEDLFSLPYELKDTSCDNLNGYIKITCESQGKYRNWQFTESGDNIQIFDMINMVPWNDEIRLPGRLTEETPESEESYIKYGSYENKQHLTEDSQVLNLKVFESNLDIIKRVYLYGMRSDNLRVTDSNQDSEYNYESVDVISNGPPEWEKFVRNRNLFNVDIQLKGKYDLGKRTC